MKNTIACLLIVSLAGCGCSTAGRVSNAAPEKRSHTDDEVNTTILRTMQRIHSDLRELKTEFPQLSVIDSAKVTANGLHYSKGWVSDSKIKGVTFNKDGCGIGVWTRYPAKSTDFEQLVGSPFMRLGNGKYLKFWTLIRAERTEQAERFKTEVSRVVSKSISEMLDSLGHEPGDHVLRLPEE